MASVLLLGVVALVSTACDEVVDFTVVNDTDEDILTWVLLADCDERGRQDDYLPERTVPAHESLRYEDIFGPGGAPEGRCVQASTLERRLILSEPYHESAVYTVEEPLSEGAPVPEQTDLEVADYPMEWLNSTYEGLQERPVATLIWLTMVVVFLVLLPLGVFVALAFLTCLVIWRLLVKPMLRLRRH